MTKTIQFCVYAEPVAKARARTFTNKYTGRVGAYTPKKTRTFENLVAIAALPYRPKDGLLTCALTAVIDIYRSIPKSMSKSNQVLAVCCDLQPITTPDGDNYEKGIFDALKGLIYRNDGQIVDCHWRKFYSETPRIEVSIQWTTS